MNWRICDRETLLILAWLTMGKLFTVPLITIISRIGKRPLFEGDIAAAQMRHEISSAYLLITDSVVLALLIGTGILRLQPPGALNIAVTFALMFLWGELWMYSTHRWMHHNRFLWMWHRHHHLSRPPWALSAISFSLGEKLVFYSFGWLLFVSAVSWVASISLWGIAAYYTVYFFASPIAHSNSGAFARFTDHAPPVVRRAMGTAATHGYHHLRLTCNYGFMTVIPDHWCGTFGATEKTAISKRHSMHNTHYKTFAEFYPFYLAQHQQPLCRALHVAGVVSSTALLVYLATQGWWLAIPLSVLPGYACGWIGHFFIEKNRPASFKYPAYSLLGDVTMSVAILIGREPLSPRAGSFSESDNR